MFNLFFYYIKGIYNTFEEFTGQLQKIIAFLSRNILYIKINDKLS